MIEKKGGVDCSGINPPRLLLCPDLRTGLGDRNPSSGDAVPSGDHTESVSRGARGGEAGGRRRLTGDSKHAGSAILCSGRALSLYTQPLCRLLKLYEKKNKDPQ